MSDDPYFSRQANLNFDKNPKSSEAPSNVKVTFLPINPVKEEHFKHPRIKPDTGSKSVFVSFTCEAKGFGDIDCYGERCVAHIITRKFLTISLSTKNRLIICKLHEQYFNKNDITIWFRFIKDKYPEKFEFVKKQYQYVLNEYKKFLLVAEE